MASWLSSITQAFTSPSQTQVEAARAEKRNKLRQLGCKFEQDAIRLRSTWETENRVYEGMLRASNNNQRSPYFARAVASKKKRDQIAAQLSLCESRFRDIETFLNTAEVSDMDQEFARLMSDVVTAEKSAPRALSRQDVGKIMGEARRLTVDYESLQSDVSATELSGVYDEGELTNDISSDFARITAAPAAAESARTSPSDIAAAQALEIVLRGGTSMSTYAHGQ